MNMIDIKIPAPPEGHEAFFNLDGIEVACTHKIVNGQWMTAQHGTSAKDILARKKRTLADWANEQELFKALVSIHRDRLEIRLVYNTDGYWIFDAAFMQRQRVYLGVPPGFAELQLVNGKWELA